MADIRIKDLTTTASSTASGDFFVIDGTTGTRKVNAFSPTFGGNATVTGALTANNTFTATGGMVSTYGTAPQFSIAPSGGRPIRFNASLGNISIQANSGGWYLGTHFLGSAGTHRGSIWASGTDDSLDFISIGDGSFSQWLSTSSTKIAIPLTTASTTTSSGALVVGNGTSGGLGVGGSINAGAVGATHNFTGGDGGSGSTIVNFKDNSGSNKVVISGIGRVACYGSIPSTDQNTGSLIVVGGVGVSSGNVNVDGSISTLGNSNSGLLQLNLVNSSTGTSASSLFRFNAGTRTASLQAYNDTHATLAGQLRVGTSNGDIVVVPSGVATATFSGSGLASFGGSVTSRIDVNGSTSAGLGLRQTGVRDWFLSAESSELRVSCLTAGSIFAFTSGTPVAIRDSSISTSTSSGALVVSGGVGVAGAIYAGGLLSSSATTSLDGLPTAGIFGGTKRVALGYNTSGDYGFVACADSGTTWKELHLNPLGGLVKVPQSTASNDAYTGAFVVGGGVGAAGAVNAGTFFGLVDGVTAPATGSGYARIYVDSADGDLKVKFGDGTVKTIATDS